MIFIITLSIAKSVLQYILSMWKVTCTISIIYIPANTKYESFSEILASNIIKRVSNNVISTVKFKYIVVDYTNDCAKMWGLTKLQLERLIKFFTLRTPLPLPPQQIILYKAIIIIILYFIIHMKVASGCN